MKDTSFPLRKAYETALSSITYNSEAVPCYYAELPFDQHPNYYIIFQPTSNTEDSTKQTHDTVSQMQVSIFTKKDLYNSGDACDTIAGSVLNAIMPTPGFNIEVDGFQVMNTKISSDIASEISMNAQVKFKDRTIIFSHLLYHK